MPTKDMYTSAEHILLRESSAIIHNAGLPSGLP